MTYIYLLAGEDLELAEREIKGFLKSQDTETDTERIGRMTLTASEPSQLKRLALTHEVSLLIEETDREDMSFGYRPENSFRVRAKAVEENKDVKELEKEIGGQLKTENNSVDLERPAEDLRAYVTSNKVFLSRIVTEIPRNLFQKRKNQNRPFSSPVSLDPELARVLVNLSGVKAGGHILDPFCGTGGILIEAGLCGIGVHGRDSSQEMVKGSVENLEEYGIISHDIQQMEVSEVGEIAENVDAVVTDLPYGKASRKTGEPVKRFLEIVDSGLPAVFMYNEDSLDGLEPEFEVYVHKNLTRYIYIENISN